MKFKKIFWVFVKNSETYEEAVKKYKEWEYNEKLKKDVKEQILGLTE